MVISIVGAKNIPSGKTIISVTTFFFLVHYILQDGQNPSNGSVADKTGRYDIAELATSSLIGETHKHTKTNMFSSFREEGSLLKLFSLET